MMSKVSRLRKRMSLQQSFFKCYYCGAILEFKEITLDHKTPICRGGKNIQSNLVVACNICNNEKSDMTEEEYLNYREEKIRAATMTVYQKINIRDILIPKCFKDSPCKRFKVDKAINFYNQCGAFDRPLLLESKDKTLLLDGYSRYLAAKELGVKEIAVQFSY